MGKDLTMALLEDWWRVCRLTPAGFGPDRRLKRPYSVRRYLRGDVNGRPRKDWRAPRLDIQLKIERLTRGDVKRANRAREVARRFATTLLHARSPVQGSCAPSATSEK
jgi:hypothetical protein